MTVPFEIPIPGFSDVTVDGYGDIEVGMQGGYHGEIEWRTMDVSTMREIADFAEAHQTAYEAYTESDYTDEASYFKAMKQFED